MNFSQLKIKNERSKILRNNILFSCVLKGIGLATSLLIVPITINYLNNEVYGIWMTLTSILFWIGAFDIGLGNGMRNFLAETISKKKIRRRKGIHYDYTRSSCGYSHYCCNNWCYSYVPNQL